MDHVGPRLQALLGRRVTAESGNPQRARHCIRELRRAAHDEARILYRCQRLRSHRMACNTSATDGLRGECQPPIHNISSTYIAVGPHSG